ncbi:hypothetical protein TeGR_g8788, partial [Tetraparma gracilis]
YYLELRTTPRQLKVDPPSKSRGSPYKGRSRSLSNSEKEKAAGDTWLLPGGIEAYVDIILEEMERWEGDAAADPVEQRLIPRLLISIDRAAGYEAAEASVELACDLFTSGNRFVVGVEIGGNPMKGDFATFVPLLEKARDIGLKVSVHCAEVPASVKDEMEEIINFRPDRLGHALFLPEACVKMLESDPIPIEACPTSNVMTLELAQPGGGGSGGGEDDSEAVVEGLKKHPTLKHWLDTGYPISISTDDSGVFNTDSTNELVVLCNAFGLDEWLITGLVWASLDHVFEQNRRVRSRLARDVSVAIKRLLKKLESEQEGSEGSWSEAPQKWVKKGLQKVKSLGRMAEEDVQGQEQGQ